MKNVIPRVKTLLKLWDVPDKSMPISKSRTQVFKSGLWRKPKVTRGESNEPSDVSASTSDPNATSRQSMNSLASIAADAVLGLNSRNDGHRSMSGFRNF
ncbi:hypothetical protein BDV93DRAFT_229120 [Ceratobasidium sp. AG-I]|nr:hypothetical protein BDV93DRAFT_229120 [Ceratobasidium sp. AG-I]